MFELVVPAFKGVLILGENADVITKLLLLEVLLRVVLDGSLAKRGAGDEGDSVVLRVGSNFEKFTVGGFVERSNLHLVLEVLLHVDKLNEVVLDGSTAFQMEFQLLLVSSDRTRLARTSHDESAKSTKLRSRSTSTRVYSVHSYTVHDSITY